MQMGRDALTPDAIALVRTVAQAGSLAAAARELGLVPSALSYRVRQLEDALDVLLFDRSSRRVKLTEAGKELLRQGEWLLGELDAVANRVKRVATGWEPQFTLAADSLISRNVLLELAEAFYAQDPPTRLRLRAETLSGTSEALLTGRADLALGGSWTSGTVAGMQVRTLGEVPFVFCVAPHHPLATAAEPLSDEVIARHRAVAVADSAVSGAGLTVGILGGQEVFTVPSMQTKLEAQLRGLGCGNLPTPLALPYIQAGHLVMRRTGRSQHVAPVHYAWRTMPGSRPGKALAWWLQTLESPATRRALLERHTGGNTGGSL